MHTLISKKRIELFLYNDSYCSKTKTFFSLTKPVEQVWFTAGTFRWGIRFGIPLRWDQFSKD